MKRNYLSLLLVTLMAFCVSALAQTNQTTTTETLTIEEDFERAEVVSKPIKIGDRLEVVFVERTYYGGKKTKRLALIPSGQKFKVGEVVLLHTFTAYEGKKFLASYDILEKYR